MDAAKTPAYVYEKFFCPAIRAEVGMSYEKVAQPFLFGDPDLLRLRDAGFDHVRMEPRGFEARLPAAGFVANLEFAYSAVYTRVL